MKVTEAVLTGRSPIDVVATMAFGYRSAFNTGLAVRLPERILLDARLFVLAETEHDEHGPVAYYREHEGASPEVSDEITITSRDEIIQGIVELAEDLAAAGIHPDAESAVRAMREDLLG